MTVSDDVICPIVNLGKGGLRQGRKLLGQRTRNIRLPTGSKMLDLDSNEWTLPISCGDIRIAFWRQLYITTPMTHLAI